MSTTDAVEAHYTHGHCWEPFLTAFRGWGNRPTDRIAPVELVARLKARCENSDFCHESEEPK